MYLKNIYKYLVVLQISEYFNGVPSTLIISRMTISCQWFRGTRGFPFAWWCDDHGHVTCTTHIHIQPLESQPKTTPVLSLHHFGSLLHLLWAFLLVKMLGDLPQQGDCGGSCDQPPGNTFYERHGQMKNMKAHWLGHDCTMVLGVARWYHPPRAGSWKLLGTLVRWELSINYEISVGFAIHQGSLE